MCLDYSCVLQHIGDFSLTSTTEAGPSDSPNSRFSAVIGPFAINAFTHLAAGKVFKPVGWAKSSLARSASASKGGKTGEKERSLRRQTPFGMLGTLKVMQLWSSWLPWAAPVLAVAS